LAPDELEDLQEELFSDRALAFQWGFRPSAKRRAEDAIHRVAMHGTPDRRTHNLELVRGRISEPPETDIESPVAEQALEAPEPEPVPVHQLVPSQNDADPGDSYQMPLFAGG
jgi:hypothetical protein